MKGIKTIFALMFAVVMVLLLQTTVFAVTGSGTQIDPYCITTGQELVNLTNSKFEKWINIKADIEINSETGNLTPAGKSHINLENHTINVNHNSFVYMTGSTYSSSCVFEMKNGKIVMDAPKSSGSVPVMMYMSRGNIILRNMTIDTTFRNEGSVILRNHNYGDFQVNSILELDHCTINDNSQCSITAIESKAILKADSSNITCNYSKSYALTIMGKAEGFDMVQCELKGKIKIADRDGNQNRTEEYIDSWEGNLGIIIGTYVQDVSITSVNYRKDIPYGEYVASSNPLITKNTHSDSDMTCGGYFSFELQYYHAKTIYWFVSPDEGNTTLSSDSFENEYSVITTESPYGYTTSKFVINNIGKEYDGLWIWATISDGYRYVTIPWIQLNVKKASVDSITIYDLDPPTQGVEPVDTDMTFASSVKPYIENAGVIFSTNTSWTPIQHPSAGTKYYALFIINLKEDYAEFVQNEYGDFSVRIIWDGVDLTKFALLDSQFSKSSMTLLYQGTIEVPNNGAGDHLDRVNTGVSEPKADGTLSTVAWNWGVYLPIGYRVREVEWSYNIKGNRVATFTVDANPGYFIDEQTEFFINDCEVTPDEIKDSGTLGNTAVLTFEFPQKGDINGDGFVDITDSALMLKHVTQSNPLTDIELKRSDINNNGKYDMLDAIGILS